MTGRPMPGPDTGWLTAPRVTFAYVVLALAFTWPLATGLARDVPWDTGDPVLNIWIIGWVADHLLRALSGEFGALSGLWHANIFYPEPLTLAYSEHLVAQAVQVLPVYALTRNLILCYNLLFLSTFVLSGLGMFLWVRHLTRSAGAGFVAGAIFAFAPLRVPQFSHLQVMSSHWMPFVLWGMAVYVERGSRRALAAGALALVAQNLSCGYFLLYFSGFVALYAVFEIVRHHRVRHFVVWRDLAVAAAVVIAATLPFLLPYLQLRDLGFPRRPFSEVVTFSADVYSYLTSPSESWVWGRWLPLRVFPKPEGDLFPSFTAIVLAIVAVCASARAAWCPVNGEAGGPRSRYAWGLAGVAALYGTLAIVVVLGLGFTHIGPLPIRVTDVGRMAGMSLTATMLLLVASPRDRRAMSSWAASWPTFCLWAAALAFILSLGPLARAAGDTVWVDAPYRALYNHVPGFDGLRVPARLGVVVLLFVAALAGEGTRLVLGRWHRRGAGLAVAIGLAAVVEGATAPIMLNGANPEPGLAPLPARLQRGAEVPPVYQLVRTLPDDAVLAEFPFGVIALEIRYMYYSTEHWRRLVNGYSGMFPPSYDQRVALLREPEKNPDRGWDVLLASGATHAVLHEDAYETPGQAAVVEAWLVGKGATIAATAAGAKILALPR